MRLLLNIFDSDHPIKMILPRLLLIICVVSFLTSCASTKPARFYTLHVSPDQIETNQVTGSDQKNRNRIGVGPLTLPKYLDRLQIVSRDEQEQLVLAEFDQWAEPLHDAMIREITQGLSKAHSQYAFYAYPWNAFGAMDYRIVITVMQFDGRLGESLDADLRWVVIDERTNQTLLEGHEQWQQEIDTNDHAGMTMAMNNTLAKIINTIAYSLTNLTKPEISTTSSQTE